MACYELCRERESEREGRRSTVPSGECSISLGMKGLIMFGDISVHHSQYLMSERKRKCPFLSRRQDVIL